MNDEQALEVLAMLDAQGLARTARDISVNRIKALMELPNEVRALETTGGRFHKEGFEYCKTRVLKLIEQHRKDQNW